MLKINDGRATNEKRLKDIETDGYFYFYDDLYRRVENNDIKVKVCMISADESILVYIVDAGIITALHRDEWVMPVADSLMTLEIQD